MIAGESWSLRRRRKQINGLSATEIEEQVEEYVNAKLDENDFDASIRDVVLSGSQCRGLEGKYSDLDVVVELRGNEREDDLFNLLHEDKFSRSKLHKKRLLLFLKKNKIKEMYCISLWRRLMEFLTTAEAAERCFEENGCSIEREWHCLYFFQIRRF